MNKNFGFKFYTYGFSIIELLFVISLIAVISSMAAINVASRAGLAKDASVKNNLMIIRGAIARYYSVHSKFPDNLQKLSGSELNSLYLQWRGANACGAIAYDAAGGRVYLVSENGSRPAALDSRGEAYSGY